MVMKNFLYLFLIVFGLGIYSCAGEPNLVIPDIDEAPGNTDDTDNDDGDGDGTVDDGKDVEFTEDELKLTRKRGLYLTSDQFNVIKELEGVTLNANLGWVYNMCDENSHSYGVECVNFASVDIDEAGIANLSQLVADGNCKRIMAFDVPYDVAEADIQTSVDAAITKWASLQALKVPMGSPCIDITQNEHKWFEAFMAKIAELEYRVDYLCVKYHGAADFNKLQTAIEGLREKYVYPIMVTGFSVVNDNSTDEGQTACTEEQVFEFMKQAVNWMEAQTFINGYVWTSFNTDDTQGGCSSLLDANGQLNSLGNYYIKNEYEIQYGENKLLDPGFENGLKNDYWQSWNGVVTAHSERYPEYIISDNLSLYFDNPNSYITAKDLTLEQNKRYIFGGTVRIQSAFGSNGEYQAASNQTINIQIYNMKGTAATKVAEIKSNSCSNTEISGEFTVTSDMSTTFRFKIARAGGSKCYGAVDDVYVQEIIE